MSESFEDSLPPSGPSIAERASRLLGSVCRVAAAAPPQGRLTAALDRIVRWTGADRAFVAERGTDGNPAAPRIVARSARPNRASPDPSRTIVARATAAARVFESASPGDDPRIGDAPSVRALRLGFVAAFPLGWTLTFVNAFELGAQSVNPQAQTIVAYTFGWGDAAKEADATNSLINQGVDVITMHVDSPPTIISTAE